MEVTTKNQNVINIAKHMFPNELSQNLAQNHLKRHWRILKPKWHSSPFIHSVVSDEGSFMPCGRVHRYLPEALGFCE